MGRGGRRCPWLRAGPGSFSSATNPLSPLPHSVTEPWGLHRPWGLQIGSCRAPAAQRAGRELESEQEEEEEGEERVGRSVGGTRRREEGQAGEGDSGRGPGRLGLTCLVLGDEDTHSAFA